MNIEKEVKTILNFLRVIGIEVWIAKNEKFENYPMPFSFYEYDYNTIINFLVKYGITFSESSVVIERSAMKPVVVINLDKHAIEKLITLFYGKNGF